MTYIVSSGTLNPTTIPTIPYLESHGIQELREKLVILLAFGKNSVYYPIQQLLL